MQVIVFKLVSLVAILCITLVAALLPLKMNTENETQKNILDHFAYLTGGVFLGAGLLHMLPDSVSLYKSTLGTLVP